MTPGVVGHGGVLEEQRLERQMGCMAGFLHLFDRHQILAGRRRYSTRSLPTYSATGSTSPSASSVASSASLFMESHPPSRPLEPRPSSPERSSVSETPARRSLLLPLTVFEVADGARTTWRIRDSPRLSLDSRAVVDARGKLRPREIRTAVPVTPGNQSDASDAGEEQRRSPSVVVRLMGLNSLPSSGGAGGAEQDGAELRRSASESQVRRDPSSYGFADAGSFHKPSPQGEATPISAEEFFKTVNLARFRLNHAKKAKPASRSTLLQPLQRKIFFDAEDFFPEPKRSAALYCEIEKRLRMRGIDDPAKNLETLKQILEAVQLKGLLHSKPSYHHVIDRRNLTYDHESPIVVMKPTSRSPRRPSSETPPPRSGAACKSAGPVRRERAAVERTTKEGNERKYRAPISPESPSSAVHRRPLNAATQKSAQPQRRVSTVGSPKSSPKRVGSDPLAVRSPRSRRPTSASPAEEQVHAPAADDSSTSLSESSVSASSQLDLERSRAEECRSGASLLERCDKLLHSIAAFTAADQQPSPVSVLDSSSYFGDDGGSPSPSPLAKRSIYFKDQPAADEWEELEWSPPASTNHGDADGGPDAVDHDYAYVRDVVRARRRYGDVSDAVYAALEKGCRRRRAGDATKAARLHCRLVFDTVAEILDRKRRVSPWEAFSSPPAAGGGGDVEADEEEALLRQVWAEVRRIREQVAETDDQDAVACCAVRKDMAGGLAADRWDRHAAEMSDAVRQIERQIFKDLVADTIRDLAAGVPESRPLLPRRKLVF
ncbi:hypothetical protein OPV22_014837 [Ensete ventricosum]|uniref:DUF4378 domain-containing protein n=1 Tax=Ensete ventricosum TaxID=4639 RepID=A0AAV8R6X0_ENSVE|nr:hypothetical protein OPV22_014837 [Ensete ventricosum]